MRILILGNDYPAKSFYKLFSKNKENIVFTTNSTLDNFIEFENTNDIMEFCEANEINLVLITDIELINQGIQEAITSLDISAFAPSIDAAAICSSKSYAKKFMHKNKIKTPRFFVAEKLQAALDYFKTAKNPIAIKPDNNTYQECLQFCETQNQVKKVVENFFASGNKRILLEDYLEGKNYSFWVLSDGYNAKIIGTCAKYQNEVALFEPEFLDEELKEKTYNEIILPTISTLSKQDEEYIGILGFDIIVTFDNEVYLIGYNNFFDDINVDFFTRGFNVNWTEVFEDTIIGDVFQKFNFMPKNEYMMTLKQNEKVHFVTAKTKNNLEKYLLEMEFDLKEYQEAKKIWKY